MFLCIKEKSLKTTETDNEIVIAVVLAVRQGRETFHDVFHRADKLMYQHKKPFKKETPKP